MQITYGDCDSQKFQIHDTTDDISCQKKEISPEEQIVQSNRNNKVSNANNLNPYKYKQTGAIMYELDNTATHDYLAELPLRY